MDEIRSIDGRGPAVDPDAKRKWVEGWAKTMVDIWHDRIAKVRAIDTYNLFNSVSEVGLTADTNFDVLRLVHEFLLYGIYVDIGVGREFGGERYTENTFSGNKRGQLVRDVVRKPKPWFSASYYASVMAMKEFMSKNYGDEFVMMVTNACRQIEKTNVRRAVGSDGYKHK